MAETRLKKRTIEDILSPESAREVRALHAISKSIKGFDPEKNAAIVKRLGGIRDAQLKARHERLAIIRQEALLDQEAAYADSKEIEFKISATSSDLIPLIAKEEAMPIAVARNVGECVVEWANFPGPKVGIVGQEAY